MNFLVFVSAFFCCCYIIYFPSIYIRPTPPKNCRAVFFTSHYVSLIDTFVMCTKWDIKKYCHCVYTLHTEIVCCYQGNGKMATWITKIFALRQQRERECIMCRWKNNKTSFVDWTRYLAEFCL